MVGDRLHRRVRPRVRSWLEPLLVLLGLAALAVWGAIDLAHKILFLVFG